MKTQINEWVEDCERFQNWFKSLGGNIANDEQMSEAFRRIDAKKVSDNKLFDLLEQDRINNIEVIEPIVEDYKDFAS